MTMAKSDYLDEGNFHNGALANNQPKKRNFDWIVGSHEWDPIVLVDP